MLSFEQLSSGAAGAESGLISPSVRSTASHAALASIPHATVRVLGVYDLPSRAEASITKSAETAVAVASSGGGAGGGADPRIRVRMKMRTEDIAGAAVDVDTPADVAEAFMAASQSTHGSGTTMASEGNAATMAFIANAPVESPQEVVIPCHSMVLSDRNAPPALRPSADVYTFLELTVEAAPDAALGISSRCSISLAASRSMRQPTFAVKKKQPKFGSASLFLNPLAAYEVHRERVQFSDPKDARGCVELEITLFRCGTLHPVAPPRPLSAAVADLVQAELGGALSGEGVAQVTTAVIETLATEPECAPDDPIIEPTPSSNGWKIHRRRHETMERLRERRRGPGESSVIHGVDVERVHLPKCALCPGAYLIPDRVVELYQRIFAHTGADAGVDERLRAAVTEAISALRQQQLAERALVQRLCDPVGASDIEQQTAAAVRQAEEEARTSGDADDSDDEEVLADRAARLRQLIAAEQRNAFVAASPADGETELLTASTACIGRQRASLAKSISTAVGDALHLIDTSGFAAGSDSLPDADFVERTAPHYAEAAGRTVSAAATTARRIRIRDAARRTGTVLSLNEALRLLLLDSCVLHHLIPRRIASTTANVAVPIAEVSGALWTCPIVAAEAAAGDDLVALQHCKHMKLPEPRCPEEVVSAAVPTPLSYRGFRRIDRPVARRTLRPVGDIALLPRWRPPPLLDYNAVVAREQRRRERAQKQAERNGAPAVSEDADFGLTSEEVDAMRAYPDTAACETLAGVRVENLKLSRCTLEGCFVVNCVMTQCTVRGGAVESCEAADTDFVDVDCIRSAHLSDCRVRGSLVCNAVIVRCSLDACVSDDPARHSGVSQCTLSRCACTGSSLVLCAVTGGTCDGCRDDGGSVLEHVTWDGDCP